jgi:indole-3-glycerol phosphate synthase
MHVLIETHSAENLQLIQELNPPIVGVNCRNLKSMTTDLDWFEQFVDQLPTDSVKVAESGIHDAHDLDTIYGLGYNAALVGTSLMKSGNPGTALAELLKRVLA